MLPETIAEERRISLRPILLLSLVFASLKVLIQIVGNIVSQHAGYGIFRDEMYYLICGRNLAFGYVDQPPLAAVEAHVTELLLGYNHMWSLRLFPALAGGAKVFLTGMIAWALGGGRRAAALSMLGVIAVGVYLGIDGFLSMNCFDPVFWMTCVLALIMIVRATSQQETKAWWILLGISAGLGLENKDSEVFFLVCVLVALLLTPERRILWSKWFAVAMLLIVAIAMPNLLWQIHNHFPTLEWLRDVAKSDKDVKLSAIDFLKQQVMMLTPWTILLWLTGIIWLIASRTARVFRFLGILYPIFLAWMILMHAKDYYLAPIYPLYFAAGAVAWFHHTRNHSWKNALAAAYALLLIVGMTLTIPMAIPVLSPEKFVAFENRIGQHPKDTENHDPTILPQFYADRFGWKEMVEKVARIYNSLPPEERAVTGIYGSNYGKASAINLFGPQYGLPVAISGHQNYWMWGPRGYTGQEMIVLTMSSQATMDEQFASCRVVDTLDHPLAMPWEHGPIYLCKGKKVPFQQDWEDYKFYY